MPNTYTQIYIQIVFAVKGREKAIPKQHKEHVHKYITGVVQERKHKLIAIHCMPDHIHIFIGMKPDQGLSDLVKDIKTASTKFIKRQEWMKYGFSWQRGFGAFSYSKSHISRVARYVENQEARHKKQSFKKEFIGQLKKMEIQYEEKYLFDFYE